MAAVLMIPVVSVGLAAQNAREAIRPASGKADPRKATKGPLPDPVLLDGSQHPAEKQSEQGMIGDFELPGDENVREGEVGGGQGPAGEQEQPEQQQGGGGGQQVAQQPPEAGGGQQQAEQQPGGPEGQAGGQGAPIATPEGIQVASLQGEGGGNAGDVPAGQKRQQVTIGDSAMQIKTQPNAPTVVGAQQSAGQTQQHEKTTGTGGRPPTGSNSNRGSERGRAMPAGL